MPLITDPDLLTQGTEVTYVTATKTITLTATGNLNAADGVTLKCLYSFSKEVWNVDATLIKYDFPFTPITDEQFQVGVSTRNNGWKFTNDTSRGYIRTAGWQEVSSAGAINREYAGVITLGSLVSGSQVYRQQASGGSASNFANTGAVNEPIQIYGDSTNGNFDYRAYMKLFVRKQGNTYAIAQLSDIGVTTMTYQVYRFPLTNTADAKILGVDTIIDANADGIADVSPYTGMSITYYSSAQSRTIGGSNYNFGIIVNGNNGTAEQIYTFVQWSLCKNADIDAGTGVLNGNIAEPLLQFVGDNLYTLNPTNPQGGGSGIYIDNFNNADINRIYFKDNTGTNRQFPYTASLALNFSSTLQSDSAAVYRVFFTNDAAGANVGNNFGTSGAILINSSSVFSTTNRARTSNVATITTATAHGLAVGDLVTIAGLGGTGFNVTAVVVTAVGSTTTFSYSNSGTNVTSTADTGGTVRQVMGGKVSAASAKSFGFDYDSNVQRGTGSAATDAPITVVAIGLSNAQYVLATGTIARSTSNSVSLVAPQERNYLNP